MTKPCPIKTLAALTAAALFAACGGGGNGGPIGVPPAARFDAAAALEQLLTVVGEWSVSGRGSDGRDYTATLSVAPGARAAYPLSPFGIVGRTSVQTSEVRTEGQAPFLGNATVYVPDNLALPQGFSYDDDDGVTCSSVESGSTPSASAAVGDGGLMLSTIAFDSCVPGATAVVGTTEVRWTLEASDGVPYFCLATTYYEPGFLADGNSDTLCFEIDGTGRLGSRAILRLQSPGFTLEMRG